MKSKLLRGVAPLVACLVCASSAAAQSVRGYAANAFDPSSPGSDWYTTDSLDLRGNLRPQYGLLVDWAYANLENRQGGIITRVLTDQVTVHGRASLVLADRYRFGIDMPVSIYEHGDSVITPKHEQATGDIRIDGDARLFGTYGNFVRGTAGLELFAPTGTRNRDTSDGTFRIAPHMLFAGDVKAFEWAAKVSYMFRPLDASWEGRQLGSQVALAISGGVNINDRFAFGPELNSMATVTGGDAFHSRAVPIELLLGGRVRVATDFQIGSAIGGRITDGDGAAKLRVLAIFEYAPDVCVDKDGDGICAYEDACPEVDGVRTNSRFTNGCPPKHPHTEPPTPEPAQPEPEPPKD